MKSNKKLLALILFSLILILSISIVSANELGNETNLDDTLSVDEINSDVSVDNTQEELSSSNVIYISPEGSGTGITEADPTNWSNALSKANSGDTIKLLNGTYIGINDVKQTIYQSITLKGSGNSVIDAQQNGGFFSIGYGASVTLENLSLINAYTGKHYGGPDGTDAPFSGEGGIINDGTLTVIDCYFLSNKGFGTEGGSIRNNNVLNVYNTTFLNNSGAKGASIFCEKGSKLNIYNSDFQKGFSKKGNAIYADENAVVRIYNSTLGNAYGKSGLIVIKKSSLYMYDSNITGARSIDTAGVVNIDKQSIVEIYRCIFEKNTATGGVLLFNEKNETGDGDGGAIVVEKGATNVVIKDSIFKANTAKNRGGAIYIESDTSITIDNCTFEGNKAGYGDNIYCYKSPAKLSISNSNFEIKSTLETQDIDYGEIENVKISYDDGTNAILNPTVILLLDGKDTGKTVSNQNTIQLSNLDLGNHTVRLQATDSNSNNYIFTQDSSIFVVGGENIVVDATYSITDEGYINIKITDEYGRNVANKDVSVIIDGTNYAVKTDENGLATIKEPLPSGEHNISLSVDGKVVSNNTASKISISDSTNETKNAVTVKYSYNDDGTIEATVTDENSKVVSDVEVKLTINGVVFKALTDSNGVARFSPDNIDVGEYDVQVEVSGKNVTSTSSKTIKVLPSSTKSSIIASNITRAFNSPYDFTARLLDKNANPLKNKNITFVINGNNYDVKTDEYGNAKLSVKLAVGEYQVIVENPATGEKASYAIKIVKRISGNKNIQIDYSYSTTYKVRIFSDNGQAVGAGEKVIVKIDGKKVKTLTTDKNGYVAYKIKNNNLAVKTHKITVEYKGVSTTNKLVVKQILKAKNVNFKKSKKTKKFTATLKTSKGKAIKNKKITFKVKGKTYTAKTNKKGVATIKLTNLKKVGKYSITIKYLKTSIKKTIKIKK